MIYKIFIKPVFFLLPPETAHHITLSLLEIFLKIPGGEWLIRSIFHFDHPALIKEFSGLKFPNPVGLAAGFDKDGRHLRAMAALGFGFIETGTVTPLPQPGNEQPRLFRLRLDKGLVNRMGFNNRGVDVMAEQLKRMGNRRVVIGGNIGKNKNTPNDKAIDDYETCFQKLFDYVDYFVINISSPNTPGLRSLQEKEPLKKLLTHLQALNRQHETTKPIFLKIAPDLTTNQLDDIVEIVIETGITGVVATNTTVSREGLRTPQHIVEKIGNGGLSGIPLQKRSTEIIRYLHSKSAGKFIIMGVGGIHSPEDAQAKLEAGADLLQIYTGFVYEGPSLVKRINRLILDRVKKHV